MFGNGFADCLPVITGYSFFTAAERIDDRNFRMIVIKIIVCTRNQKQAELIRAGKRTEHRFRHIFAAHFQIFRFQRRLRVGGIVIMT